MLWVCNACTSSPAISKPSMAMQRVRASSASLSLRRSNGNVTGLELVTPHAWVCMHACMYVCTYVWMYAWVYVCMYVCMYGCMHGCMYVCTYVCMDVCMGVCMYPCIHVCMNLWIDGCTYSVGSIPKIDINIFSRIHACKTVLNVATMLWMHGCVDVWIDVWIYAWMDGRMQKCM